MPDEIIGTEDLKQLRIIAPTDRRAYDTWAFDDTLCSGLLNHAFANPARKECLRWHWERAIQIYWREGKSRRDLANELSLSPDAIKSLVKTIRATADEFIAGGSVVATPDPPKTPKAKWSLAHTIGKLDIFALFDDDAEKAIAASTFLEEFRRLSTINLLGLFNEGISGRLITILDKSEALGVSQNPAVDVAGAFSAATTQIKSQVARDDPFEGRPLSFQPDRRTSYEVGQRGRPRKEKPAVSPIQRKRGRPRKTVSTLPITDAPIASDIFLTPGMAEQFHEGSAAVNV